MSLLEKFGSFDIDPQKVETLDSEEILLIADLNLYVLYLSNFSKNPPSSKIKH
jgi:hypothetical protein